MSKIEGDDEDELPLFSVARIVLDMHDYLEALERRDDLSFDERKQLWDLTFRAKGFLHEFCMPDWRKDIAENGDGRLNTQGRVLAYRLVAHIAAWLEEHDVDQG